MTNVTSERVREAYAALSSGDQERIQQYWAEDLKWLIPGHSQFAGWHYGRTAFLEMMGNLGRLSDNSFTMETTLILTNDEYSTDVSRNVAYRAGGNGTGTVPYSKLDITAIHLLRWQDGRIIEGRGAIVGDGAAQYDQFWSPVSDQE